MFALICIALMAIGVTACSAYYIKFIKNEREGYRNYSGSTYAVGESVYDALPDRFTRGDLQAVVHRHEMKTPVKVILSNWKKLGMIVKRGENEWQKKKK